VLCFDIRVKCRAAQKGTEGKFAPGLKGPRALITSNASRSGGPHKINQQ